MCPTDYNDLVREAEAALAEIPETLMELRLHLRQLLRLLVFHQLDSWVDELLVEERAGWTLPIPNGG